MNRLTSFSHDRSGNLRKEADRLFHAVETFGDSRHLEDFYATLSKSYGLKKGTIKHCAKRHVVRRYSYRRSRFPSRLCFRFVPVDLFVHVLKLVYLWVFSKNRHDAAERCHIIVDDVKSEKELNRVKELLQWFDPQEVTLITTKDLPGSKNLPHRVFVFPYHRYYSRQVCKNVILSELKTNIWKTLWASVKTKTNLFPVLSHVALEYSRAETLFSAISGKFLLQERFYETNAIRNEVFKRHGGVTTIAIQKNIVQLDRIFFYVDADWILALGDRTSERLLQYGGRIEKQIPVGSFFMSIHCQNKLTEKTKSAWDIVMVGQGMVDAMDRLDSYNGFVKDYYSCFQWLVEIQKRHPELRVAIIHHSTSTVDAKEEKIIENSGVVLLDPLGNSYDAAVSSRCVVTFGSTMGFELLGHRHPVIFLAPRGVNAFLPDSEDTIMRPPTAETYEEFEMAFFSLSKEPDLFVNKWEPLEQYCLQSYGGVSEKIASLVG